LTFLLNFSAQPANALAVFYKFFSSTEMFYGYYSKTRNFVIASGTEKNKSAFLEYVFPKKQTCFLFLLQTGRNPFRKRLRNNAAGAWEV